MANREEIIGLLEGDGAAAVSGLAKKDPGLFRTLVSLSYDKGTILSWRAIEAVGLLARELSRTNPDRVRTLAQRLLWMLREESGNNPWSVPDMLGEMVRNVPDQLADLAPIIASFHDEEILRCGVLRALVRIGEVRPDLVRDQEPLVGEYLAHADPVARAYAILLAGIIKKEALLEPLVAGTEGDDLPVRLYEDGEFRDWTLRGLARKTIDAAKKG
ncbi:MAG: DVU0298 family protein [Thermodesulfovibrionales bacterium]